jgi:hypothetical protein
MMDVDQELEFIDMLMESPAASVRDHWLAFREILDSLSISHTQAFFDVNVDNKRFFVRFADWLEELAKQFQEPEKRAALEGSAYHFRTEPPR